MIRGFESGDTAMQMETEEDGGGNDGEDESAWVDEEMPVDPSFKHAIRDVSDMHR